tara:strand:+ start:511 stop:894 length:384 start_codon:yes stop_codon:yes gene_type:complete
MKDIIISISIGELIDKISILEIKKEYVQGKKLNNVDKELSQLKRSLKDSQINIAQDLIEKLRKVNSELWSIEDKIRIKEKEKDFNDEFIQLARSVYIKNDERAKIKKMINIKYSSNIIEEKSYVKYS